MAIKSLGIYRSPQYTIEFKKKDKNVFAECSSGLLPKQTIPIDRHTFGQLTDPNLSLSKIVKHLLAEQYTPSIRNGKVEWTPPSTVIDRAAKVEQYLSRAVDCIKKKKYPDAVTALLEAQTHAAQALDPFGEAHFLEKLDQDWVQSLYEKTQDPRIELLLLQKDAVRRAFEIALQKISANSPQQQQPTCFVCFSFAAEEKDIQDWVEKTFVPDLDIIGVKPVYCFRDLGQGKELLRFEKLISVTDLAAIMCTPGLQRQCKERQGHSSGAALEVDLAELRRENPAYKETIYTIYLRGKFPTLCPSPIIQLILGTELTTFGPSTSDQLYTYYTKAFELFGEMRKINREYSRNVIKKEFLKEIRIILKDRKIDKEAVLIWQNEKRKRIKAVKAAVQGTIEELNGRSLIPRDRLSLNTPHPSFVGRESLLGKLEKDFQLRDWKSTDPNPTKIRILCGPGGIGKTELAIMFGNLHLPRFSLIWLIRTESPQLLEEDYRSLAIALNIFIENDDLAAIQRKVHKALERESVFSLPWLLIFDNVDKILTIPQRGGCVIATSQLENIWTDRNAFILVPPFTIEETEQLFQKLQRPTPQSELVPLVTEVEGFPVLLEQMGRFLERTSCPVSTYLAQLNTENDLVWAEIDGHRYPKVLGKVFEKSLDRLQQNHAHAYAFIQFCAYLNPDHISLELLEFWVEQQKLPLTHKWQIVKALKDSMLMRFNDPTQSFSIHRLMQIVIQRLNEKKNEDVYSSVVHFLSIRSKRFDWHSIQTWHIGEECVQHLDIVLGNPITKLHPRWESTDKRWRSDLLLAAGVWVFRVQGGIMGGLLIDGALELAKEVYGEESREVALCYSELGACSLHYKDLKTSHQSFKKSLEIRKKILSENHPDTAASYNNLALVTEEGHEKSLEYCQKALEIWQKPNQGQLHPDMPMGYHTLAIIQQTMGRTQEALHSLHKAIELHKTLAKKPNLQTAESFLRLGELFLVILSPDQAWSAFQNAFEIYKAVYGTKHPKVAHIRYKIAKSLFQVLQKMEGPFFDSDQMHRIYEALGGAYDFRKSKIHTFRKNVFQQKEDLESFLTIRQKGLQLLQYLSLVWGYFNTDISVDDVKSIEENSTYFVDLQFAIKIVHNPSLSDAAMATNNTGIVLETLGRHPEALPYYKEAFKLAIRIKDPNSRDFFNHTLKSLHKQPDTAFALKMKDELLAFCIAECDEKSDFAIQFQAFNPSKSEDCIVM